MKLSLKPVRTSCARGFRGLLEALWRLSIGTDVVQHIVFCFHVCNRLPEIMKNGDAGIFPVYYSLKVRVSEIREYMAQQILVVVQTLHHLCPTLQPRAICITVQSKDSTKYAIQVFTGRACTRVYNLSPLSYKRLNSSKTSVLYLAPCTTRKENVKVAFECHARCSPLPSRI